MKKSPKLHILAMFLFLLATSFEVVGQDIRLLSLMPYGESNEMLLKARINTGGKEIKSVEAGPVFLENGKFLVTGKSYSLAEDHFLSVTLKKGAFPEESVAYRMIVTFTDGTKLISPSVKSDKSESYQWLSDMEWLSATTGWGTIRRDLSVGGDTMMIDQKKYYKGLGTHTSSNSSLWTGFEYTVPEGATEFKFSLGIQDKEPNGDVISRFIYDGKILSQDTVLSLNNTARGDRPVIIHRNAPVEAGKKIELKVHRYDSNEWGDWANFALAHFVSPFEEVIQKAQSLTFELRSEDPRQERYLLKGAATSGLPLTYTLVEGESLGRISKDTLIVNHGVSGRIVVRANQFGNGTYLAAAPVDQPVDVNRTTRLAFNSIQTYEGIQQLFLSFDEVNRPLKELKLFLYDGPEALTVLDSVLLVSGGNLQVSRVGTTFIVPMNQTQLPALLRAQITYSDGFSLWSDYLEEKGESFVFMSDLPYVAGGGWAHGYRVDKGYDNTPLELMNKQYAKGFGFHASAYARTQNPEGFVRFKAHAGYHTGFRGNAKVVLKRNNVAQWETASFNQTTLIELDHLLNGTGSFEVYFDALGDNTNEVMDLGAPRYYRPVVNKLPQEISWKPLEMIKTNEPVQIELKAASSVANPLFYRIVKGKEYAEIKNGNILSVHTVPLQGEIVVEAFQPGDHIYSEATARQCSFVLSRTIVVEKDEVKALDGGTVIDELVVHSDGYTSGQVVVTEGIVRINKLRYVYQLTPGQNNLISFPIAANLEKISSFKLQGYGYNDGSARYWLLKEYDGRDRALNGQLESNWKICAGPAVVPNKGYLLEIHDQHSSAPVEVMFVFENVSVDYESNMKSMSLAVDFSGFMPGDDYRVYVKPKNVKGNTLTIPVDYHPGSRDLPMNYRDAVDQARLVPFAGGRKFRITLPVPDQAAEVYILNKKGTKVLHTYKYYAPGVVELPEMRKGTYPVAVKFGNEVSIKSLTIE